MTHSRPSMEHVHPAGHRFNSLIDYLRHLVDEHGVKETNTLWRSGRDQFDDIHLAEHSGRSGA